MMSVLIYNVECFKLRKNIELEGVSKLLTATVCIGTKPCLKCAVMLLSSRTSFNKLPPIAQLPVFLLFFLIILYLILICFPYLTGCKGPVPRLRQHCAKRGKATCFLCADKTDWFNRHNN